jgi:hypothetical protein
VCIRWFELCVIKNVGCLLHAPTHHKEIDVATCSLNSAKKFTGKNNVHDSTWKFSNWLGIGMSLVLEVAILLSNSLSVTKLVVAPACD